MRDLSLNIQTFSLLREQKCIYVDKTGLLLPLISKVGKYFLSRPRRYGKSLLISLLEEPFSGNKDLFEGLEIAKMGYSFPKHPVIRIDFSAIGHSSAENLKNKLLERIQEIGLERGFDLSSHDSIEGATRALIRGMSKRGSVVLLIDEYDCPILDWIENPEVATALQRVLKSFYATVKSEESHFRFIFVTGITKIAKTSLFSVMANLTDLSFEDNYATLLGYTEEEIKRYFSDYLEQAAKEHNKSVEALLIDIRSWYNGYRFALKSDDAAKKVYSPLSVMNFFKTAIFDNYWFMTATPSFLAKLMKDNYLGFRELEVTGMGSSILHPFDLEDISPVALAYQTGYLTIRHYQSGVFDLAYPNEEVRQSMTTYLLGAYTNLKADNVIPLINNIRKAFATKEIDLLQNNMERLFANIPYQHHNSNESYYHGIMQTIGTLLGIDMQSEVSTSRGRIDLVVNMNRYLYLIELKVDKSAEEALEQIQELGYVEKYQGSGKEIILIGINFSSKEKRLSFASLAK